VVLSPEADQRLRNAAFDYLNKLAAAGTSLVTQRDLAAFTFDGSPVRLMAPQQGIWKPAQLSAALSLRTVYAADPSQAPMRMPSGRTTSFAISGEATISSSRTIERCAAP
jgi:putative restriction endonuclease